MKRTSNTSPRAAWHRAVYRAWCALDQAEQALRAPWCVGATRHNWQAALQRAQAQRTAAIQQYHETNQ